MKVLVSDEIHIFRLPDNTYWSDAVNNYEFYKRYMEAFDKVRLVGKLKNVEKLEGKCIRLDGPNLEIFGIPYFQGPTQFAKKVLEINSVLKNVSDGCNVAIMRMPSVTSMMVLRHLNKALPLGGEIIYDPYNDVHDPDSNIILRIIWKVIAAELARFCKRANGVAYVTENAIQEHFPSYARLHGEDKTHFETHYSSITLKDDAFAKSSRKFDKISSLRLVMSDVAMNNERKGERILINAVKIARDRGYNVTATIIGDGNNLQIYKKLANSLGIERYIEFTGLFPSADEVREVMKKADIFVFPTKAEGLPRGVLEAMAIALPVLSTPVGGIPEVLEEKYLFDPLDAQGFADEICRLYNKPDELTEMSRNNLEKAEQYRNTKLQAKRNAFYDRLVLLSAGH